MRKVANWIDGFMELSADMPSPAILRQWSAISIIAGALERRVWLHTSHPKPLYPNLYVFLVAPPGVGKTSVTGIVNDFWRVTKNSDTEHIHIAPSATSSAAFIDALNDSERRLVRLGEPEPLVKFSALSIASDELGAFLPEYNPAFIQLLTLLYDCNFFDEKKRTKSLNIKVEKPVVNFIAATTPSFLNGMLPEGAWDQGFLARVMIVYTGEQVVYDLFAKTSTDKKLRRDLESDLNSIFQLYGEIEFTEEAKRAMNNWHKNPQPIPSHPRLIHYRTRRTAHVLKLCMIASVAESDDLIIRIEHFEKALDWLLEMELHLPDIFKSMAKTGSKQAIDECWHFAYTIYMKEKKPILEHRLVNFLHERVPVHEVFKVLEVMVRSGMLKEDIVLGGGKAYLPADRKASY